jgi:hypothetical protein
MPTAKRQKDAGQRRRRRNLLRGGGYVGRLQISIDAHGSSFGEDQTRLALEGIEESGALRLEVAVRDVGLRCHTSHAQDVLDMLLGLTMRVKEEKPNELRLEATRRRRNR